MWQPLLLGQKRQKGPWQPLLSCLRRQHLPGQEGSQQFTLRGCHAICCPHTLYAALEIPSIGLSWVLAPLLQGNAPLPSRKESTPHPEWQQLLQPAFTNPTSSPNHLPGFFHRTHFPGLTALSAVLEEGEMLLSDMRLLYIALGRQRQEDGCKFKASLVKDREFQDSQRCTVRLAQKQNKKQA